ncbi:MAG: DMT family transporter [Bacteroidetes bacterium]|nr:DMT family transporter [Bacteroidota bacterium]
MLALLAILFWSTVASAFKLTLRNLDIYNFLFYSSITAFGVLLIYVLIQKKVSILKSLKLKDYWRSAIRGLLNPFLYYLMLFEAYHLLPAQEAQALNYTWPIILSVFAVLFLGQKFSYRNAIAILIGFFGVLVISIQGNFADLQFSNLKGSILAISSAVFWASFWILNLRDKRDASIKLLMNFSFGAIYITIFILLKGGLIWPDMTSLIGTVYCGVFEMGLTFMIWLKALQYADDTAKMSNLIFLVPFLSLIFIAWLVGEKILPATLLGLVLIFTGILIQQMRPESPWFQKGQ